jgi:hypothetical protein
MLAEIEAEERQRQAAEENARNTMADLFGFSDYTLVDEADISHERPYAIIRANGKHRRVSWRQFCYYDQIADSFEIMRILD